MKLLIDAGNTRVKWQLRQAGRIIGEGGAPQVGEHLFAGLPAEAGAALKGVFVCSVRNEADRVRLETEIRTVTQAPVTSFRTAGSHGDLVCGYQNPDAMGTDRWLALVGARGLEKGPLVVIDAGSAITVDWVGESGEHLGGYILPGRRLMLDSIRQKTAKVLFQPGESLESTAPGKSTEQCVLQGMNWLLGAIAKQLQEDLRLRPAQVYVTGGDAHLLLPGLPESARHLPDLVFEGMERMSCAV